MDRELPDEARGHSQGNLLYLNALRPQKVMIKDQYIVSFLKSSIKYTKLNIHKLIQGSVFLPGRGQSLPFLQHVPIVNTLQCWILSLEKLEMPCSTPQSLEDFIKGLQKGIWEIEGQEYPVMTSTSNLYQAPYESFQERINFLSSL